MCRGGFADAEAWPVLAGRYREALEENLPGVVEDLPDCFGRVPDEELAADLVQFWTGGDGTYPVWVGRGESGEVTSVVVETGCLPGLTVR
ncbi:DUF4241 domain-containing protein [Streptomyces sp. MUM 178J]|uniref:DUF4241 domain-containing protein n=1 Tax=Streptomyces sp. MUM 178J TaxID=2791991 RepID=UPI001F042C52|nr:DUF4241 domain-containing protein [Streptomyces sp. MUM 178J]WRQ80342.1 DUF4241 domain-containing protein [Streptomyces sp. MUM 178J]